MKYDGTGWCKQTAAIEEGRHRSGSFTHWCAWRPGTKSLLMKVLAEAQGVRGLGMVSISRAKQTALHRTVPYRARTSLPGTLLLLGCCLSQMSIFPELIIHTNSCVRMDLSTQLLLKCVLLGQTLWF